MHFFASLPVRTQQYLGIVEGVKRRRRTSTRSGSYAMARAPGTRPGSCRVRRTARCSPQRAAAGRRRGGAASRARDRARSYTSDLAPGARDGGHHRRHAASAAAHRRARCASATSATARVTRSASCAPAVSGIQRGRVVDAEARPPGGESLQRAEPARAALHSADWPRRDTAATCSSSPTAGSSGSPWRYCNGVAGRRHGLGPGPQRRRLGVRFPRDLSDRAVVLQGSRSTARSEPCEPTMLELPPRTSKPRTSGLTMMVDGGLPTRAASKTSWRAGPSSSTS